MDTQMLVNVLAWSLIVLGGALVSALVWFAMRIVAQLDKLEQLFTRELHAVDLRITKLEDWRSTLSSGHGRPFSVTE